MTFNMENRLRAIAIPASRRHITGLCRFAWSRPVTTVCRTSK